MSLELRARLKEARRKLGMTQAQASLSWGVPLNTLICWENNRRSPATFTLTKLNALLDEILCSESKAQGLRESAIAPPSPSSLPDLPPQDTCCAAGG